MKKFYPVLIVLMIYASNTTAQVPTLLSHSYDVGYGSVNVCINYAANDVNDIGIQIQLGRGPGDIYYDFNFRASADSTHWCQLLSNLTVCQRFRLLMNLSNSNGVGQVYDPLFEFTTGCTLGVDELTNGGISMQHMYGSQLIFKSEKPLQKNTIAKIYDLSGREILSEIWDNNELHIATIGLSNGLYFVKITGGQHVLYTDRLVVAQ